MPQTINTNLASLNAQRSQRDAGGSLSEEQKEQLLVHFKFDKPYLVGYLMWLGALPSEESRQVIKVEDGKKIRVAKSGAALGTQG